MNKMVPFSSERPLLLPKGLTPEKHNTESKGNRKAQGERRRVRAQEYISENIDKILDEVLPEDTYCHTITHPETGEQITVFDVETLKKLFIHDVHHAGVRVLRQKLALALFERHCNDTGITTEQLERGDYSPRSLFYYPSSLYDAVDSIAIADSEAFHLPLWELSKRGVMRSRDDHYPTVDGSELSAFEARVALELFHPSYGDGRRSTKDGVLYVKNKEYNPEEKGSKKRLPMGDTVLRQYSISQILKTDIQKQSRTIHEGLKVELPHLLENNELQLGDFRELTLSQSGEFNESFSLKEIPKNGFVMIAGARQYVGKQFAGGYVQGLSNEKALVLDEDKNIQAIFTIVPKEHAILDKNPKGDPVPRTTAAMTQVMCIPYASILPEASGFREHTVEHKRIELMQLVTHTVNSIIEIAEHADTLFSSEYGNGNIDAKTIQSLRQDLLDQAALLVSLASAAKTEEQLRAYIETFQTDVRAFVALQKHAEMEALLEGSLEYIPTTELSEQDKEEMQALVQRNYLLEYPNKEDEAFRQGVYKSFVDALDNPDTSFYILRDQDRIVSFNRFDDLGDGVLYFGSFNARALYKGIGGILLEKTIQQKLSESEKIQAHCDPKSAISKKYIESGFVATQLVEAWGKPSFEIWRSDRALEALETKQMSESDLVALANVSAGPEDDYFVREVASDDRFEELDSGLSYLLTRYFTHNGKTYAAFEIQPDVSKDFALQNTLDKDNESREEV